MRTIRKSKRADIWQLVERTRASYMRWALALVTDALDEQAAPVIAKAKTGVLTDDLIDALVPTEPIAELILTIYKAVGAEFAESVFEGLAGKRQGTRLITKQFESEIYQANIEAWLKIQGAEKVVDITKTTAKNLKYILARFIESGADINEMAAYIETQVAVTYAGRGRTIARTEVIGASNKGAMEGATMTGLDLQKEWISTIDDRTRDDHAAVDGQTVDKDSMFQVGGDELEYPADPVNGSPGNIINCRCAVGFIKKV